LSLVPFQAGGNAKYQRQKFRLRGGNRVDVGRWKSRHRPAGIAGRSADLNNKVPCRAATGRPSPLKGGTARIVTPRQMIVVRVSHCAIPDDVSALNLETGSGPLRHDKVTRLQAWERFTASELDGAYDGCRSTAVDE
jgi:hypothetical protein